MGSYQILSQVQASVGEDSKSIGGGAVCRFCGNDDRQKFRTRAHTFPEALGNKWVFSDDECDDCNARFSVYEDALTKAVGPLLTLGGTKGKRGVRQTGRSDSNAFVRHSVEDGQRRLSVQAKGDFSDVMKLDPLTGCIRLNMPIVGDCFVPRLAFKALCKSAVGLLPMDELPHVRGLLVWLAEPDSEPDFDNLGVGISFASVGNAPPLVAGTLLRRTDDTDPGPYLVYVFVAGSVCLQIQVPVDRLDLHVPPVGRLGIQWSNQLAKPEGGWEKMSYSEPIQLDWHSAEATLQPIKAFQLDFDPATCHGNITPVLREAW